MDINKIRKINPTIVHGNRIDSFEKQLIKLNYGELDMNYPMLISTDSRCLKFISKIDVNRPLLINPKKVLRIKTRDCQVKCVSLLRNSWEQGKCFDKNNCLSDLDYNKKIEQLIKYTRLQLPNYLSIALSDFILINFFWNFK